MEKVQNLNVLNDLIRILSYHFKVIRKSKSIVTFSVEEENLNDYKRINFP